MKAFATVALGLMTRTGFLAGRVLVGTIALVGGVMLRSLFEEQDRAVVYKYGPPPSPPNDGGTDS